MAAQIAQLFPQFGLVNFDPAVPVLRKMLIDIDFKRFATTTMNCIDSAAFVNVGLVSLKSAAYVFGEYGDGLSCRLRYSECAVTSLAATVYHFVLGVAMTALSIVTIGKVEMVVNQMRKEWLHAGLAGGACIISCVGTADPGTGILLNGLGIAALFRWITGDISTDIRIAYQRNNAELKRAVTQVCVQNNLNYDQQFAPIFRRLDEGFRREMDLQGMAEMLIDVAGQFPVIPYASPDVLADNLRQMMADQSNSAGHYVHT